MRTEIRAYDPSPLSLPMAEAMGLSGAMRL